MAPPLIEMNLSKEVHSQPVKDIQVEDEDNDATIEEAEKNAPVEEVMRDRKKQETEGERKQEEDPFLKEQGSLRQEPEAESLTTFPQFPLILDLSNFLQTLAKDLNQIIPKKNRNNEKIFRSLTNLVGQIEDAAGKADKQQKTLKRMSKALEKERVWRIAAETANESLQNSAQKTADSLANEIKDHLKPMLTEAIRETLPSSLEVLRLSYAEMVGTNRLSLSATQSIPQDRPGGQVQQSPANKKEATQAQNTSASASASQQQKKTNETWQVYSKKRTNSPKRHPKKLVVLPKDRGARGDWLKEQLENLDLPAELPISNIRPGLHCVDITCPSAEDAEVVKRALENCREFCLNATVEEKRPPTSRVAILQVPKSCMEEEIRSKLKQALPMYQQPASSLQLLSRQQKNGLMRWVVSLPASHAKTLLNVKRLFFGTKASPLERPHQSLRCFRCQMLGHVEAHCVKEQFCAVCGGRHPTVGCQNTPLCINCRRENFYFGTNHDTGHEASHHTCPTYRAYAESLKL